VSARDKTLFVDPRARGDKDGFVATIDVMLFSSKGLIVSANF